VLLIPSYSEATIIAAFDALGRPTKCEIAKSSGDAESDAKIVAAVKAIKLQPMLFAAGIDDEMVFRVPLSHRVPAGNVLSVGEGEAFVFASDGAGISVGGDLVYQPNDSWKSSYLPEDMKYDKEVETLYREKISDRKGGVISFDHYNGYRNMMDMADSPAHIKMAEAALKEGKTLEAVNEYLLASAEPMFCGNVEKARTLFEKAIDLSRQLTPQERRNLIESLTNYSNTLSVNNLHGKDADYVAQKTKELAKSELGENDRAWLPLLRVLGPIYTSQSNYVEAESTYKRELKILLTTKDPKPESAQDIVHILPAVLQRAATKDPPRQAIEETYRSLGSLYRQEGKYEDLRNLNFDALQWLRGTVPCDSIELILPICELAKAALKLKPSADISGQLDEVIKIADSYVRPRIPEPVFFTMVRRTALPPSLALNGLAECLVPIKSVDDQSPDDRERVLQAERLVKSSYKLSLKMTEESLAWIGPLEYLCRFLERHGKAEEAAVLCEGALKKVSGENETKSRESSLGARADKLRFQYAIALRAAGRAAEATRVEAGLGSSITEKENKRLKGLESRVEVLQGDPQRNPLQYLDARLILAGALLDKDENLTRGRTMYQECLNDFAGMSYSKTYSDSLQNSGIITNAAYGQVPQRIFQCVRALANHSCDEQDRKLVMHSLDLLESEKVKGYGEFNYPTYSSVLLLSSSKLFGGDEAEYSNFVRELIKRRDQAQYKNDPSFVETLKTLAQVDRATSNFREAEEINKQLLAIEEKRKPAEPRRVADQTLAVAEASVRNNNFIDAELFKGKAEELAHQEMESCPSKLDISAQLNNLAQAYVEKNRFVDALKVLREARMAMAPNRGIGDSRVRIFDWFIDKCVRSGNFDEARDFLTFMIEQEVKESGAASPSLCTLSFDLAELCLEQAHKLPNGADQNGLLTLSADNFAKAAASCTKAGTAGAGALRTAVRKRIFLLTVFGWTKEAGELQEKYPQKNLS
jgi:hypothetical protein